MIKIQFLQKKLKNMQYSSEIKGFLIDYTLESKLHYGKGLLTDQISGFRAVLEDLVQTTKGSKQRDLYFIEKLSQFSEEVLEICQKNIINQEEVDLMQMDHAKQFIVNQRKIEGLIIDEYSKKNVDA